MKAQLKIVTGKRGSRTILEESFFTQPFKLANITEDKTKPLLDLMIMSASPGILDGDLHDISISVSDESSLRLFTQSYQRLYNMKSAAAQHTCITLGKKSFFSYLPHPVVPHESSSYVTTTQIYLGEGSTLLWGEVLTCGRKLSGESFKFSKLQSRTDIFKHGKICLTENILIEPGKLNPGEIGQLEGYTHQATLLFINEDIQVSNIIQKLLALLGNEEEIELGITATPLNGLMIRLLGNKAEQLFNLLKKAAAFLEGPDP